ncbi:unnamed protein product [Phytomonas sp. Hart1]|nr:unnamed protein product [Phytomonas sp. Hart1]|eukprot:CCW67209.1 unnamed protein product [Phytomonas sp. isolate Hart1]
MLCEKWNLKYSDAFFFERALPAFQACSTLYSFSTSMVLPWYDQTVLLGPSISRLEDLPSKFPFFSSRAVIHSTDNYRHQIAHITSALAATGIGFDLSSLLTCVSTIVPTLKDIKTVPWASELFYKGYNISTFQKHEKPSEGVVEVKEKINTNPEAFCPPFVHVYGGTPLMARRIAEEAVDAFLHNTSAIPEQAKKNLKKCTTRNLKLLSYDIMPVLNPKMETKSSRALGQLSTDNGKDPLKESMDDSFNKVGEPLLWVKKLVLGSYVEHLSDLIFRRSHVAYTSPAEALSALPYLADVLSNNLMWDEQRKKNEIEVAKTLIKSVAVRVNPK